MNYFKIVIVTILAVSSALSLHISIIHGAETLSMYSYEVVTITEIVGKGTETVFKNTVKVWVKDEFAKFELPVSPGKPKMSIIIKNRHSYTLNYEDKTAVKIAIDETQYNTNSNLKQNFILEYTNYLLSKYPHKVKVIQHEGKEINVYEITLPDKIEKGGSISHVVWVDISTMFPIKDLVSAPEGTTTVFYKNLDTEILIPDEIFQIPDEFEISETK